uniref:Uncharacterized protein n=1 Tax=Rhinopithecus bieti TaxID=61621 RepID=A0A2K6MY78_RHIBE
MADTCCTRTYVIAASTMSVCSSDVACVSRVSSPSTCTGSSWQVDNCQRAAASPLLCLSCYTPSCCAHPCLAPVCAPVSCELSPAIRLHKLLHTSCLAVCLSPVCCGPSAASPCAVCPMCSGSFSHVQQSRCQSACAPPPHCQQACCVPICCKPHLLPSLLAARSLACQPASLLLRCPFSAPVCRRYLAACPSPLLCPWPPPDQPSCVRPDSCMSLLCHPACS